LSSWVRKLTLRSNQTYSETNCDLSGSLLLDTRNKEAVIIRDGDVTVNPLPVVFDSLAAFLAAPDPVLLPPRKISPWAFLTHDNHYLLVCSEDVPFAEPRETRPIMAESLLDSVRGMAGETYYKNAHTKAVNDVSGLNIGIALTLGAISLFSVLIFGAVVLQSRMG